MVKRGLMLENEFRYLQPNYSGKLVYNIMPHDRDYGESRYGLHFEHRYARDGFYAGVNYNRVSDDDYISDFSGNIRESSENVLNQDFWMGYGRDFWTTNLRVTKNQTLTSTIRPGSRMSGCRSSRLTPIRAISAVSNTSATSRQPALRIRIRAARTATAS